MLKFVVLAAFVAVASAGVINAPIYSHEYAAPEHSAATSHSSITQHTVSHAAPAIKVAAAPAIHYAAAPVAHYAQAAPVAHYAQAAPVAHYAQAAPVAHYAAPVHKVIAAPVHKVVVAEPEAPAHYDFEYSVHDPHTGDVKEQKESRKDDAVHGFYSLIEADGSKRVVEYTADDHNGFQAVVHREPAQHPVAQKIVAPVAVKAIHAAPVYQAAPVVHAAPVYQAAPVVHAAPVHSYYHH